MRTMDQEWYAIHRHDGIIQYATKQGELYFIGGTGQAVKKFDAKKVEAIEGFPPTILVEGITHFEGEGNYKCIVDKNNTWNGWACPYILEEDIQRFCEESTANSIECGIGIKCRVEDNTLIIEELEDVTGEYTQFIHMSKLLDKDCYFLGSIGYCFEFKN